MDDQIKAKVLEWLSALEAEAKTEIPAYCQEVVGWHIAENAINAVGSLIVGVLIITAIHVVCGWFIKNFTDEDDNYCEVCFVTKSLKAVVIFVALLASAGSIWHYTTQSVKGVVAPRAVIIDHLRGVAHPSQYND